MASFLIKHLYLTHGDKVAIPGLEGFEPKVGIKKLEKQIHPMDICQRNHHAMCGPCLEGFLAVDGDVIDYEYRSEAQPNVKYSVQLKCPVCSKKFLVRNMDKMLKIVKDDNAVKSKDLEEWWTSVEGTFNFLKNTKKIRRRWRKKYKAAEAQGDGVVDNKVASTLPSRASSVKKWLDDTLSSDDCFSCIDEPQEENQHTHRIGLVPGELHDFYRTESEKVSQARTQARKTQEEQDSLFVQEKLKTREGRKELGMATDSDLEEMEREREQREKVDAALARQIQRELDEAPNQRTVSTRKRTREEEGLREHFKSSPPTTRARMTEAQQRERHHNEDSKEKTSRGGISDSRERGNNQNEDIEDRNKSDRNTSDKEDTRNNEGVTSKIREPLFNSSDSDSNYDGDDDDNGEIEDKVHTSRTDNSTSSNGKGNLVFHRQKGLSGNIINREEGSGSVRENIGSRDIKSIQPRRAHMNTREEGYQYSCDIESKQLTYTNMREEGSGSRRANGYSCNIRSNQFRRLSMNNGQEANLYCRDNKSKQLRRTNMYGHEESRRTHESSRNIKLNQSRHVNRNDVELRSGFRREIMYSRDTKLSQPRHTSMYIREEESQSRRTEHFSRQIKSNQSRPVSMDNSTESSSNLCFSSPKSMSRAKGKEPMNSNPFARRARRRAPTRNGFPMDRASGTRASDSNDDQALYQSTKPAISSYSTNTSIRPAEACVVNEQRSSSTISAAEDKKKSEANGKIISLLDSDTDEEVRLTVQDSPNQNENCQTKRVSPDEIATSQNAALSAPFTKRKSNTAEALPKKTPVKRRIFSLAINNEGSNVHDEQAGEAERASPPSLAVDEEKLEKLLSIKLSTDKDQCRNALLDCDNDITKAIDLLLAHEDNLLKL
jgi:hypothetical protein